MGIINEYEEVLIGNRKKYHQDTFYLTKKEMNELHYL